MQRSNSTSNTRSSSSLVIISLDPPKENALDLISFTRYDVHIKAEEGQLKENIKKAIEVIDAMSTTPGPDVTQYCKQVGMYYLFYLRDEKNALYYLEKFLHRSEENTQDYMDANLLIGCAKTISGTDTNIKELERALSCYDTLEQTQEVQLKRALAYFSKGFIDYHNAMQSNDADNKTLFVKNALHQLQKARKIQERFLRTFPPVRIELAHTLAIMGAIYGMQQNFEQGFDLLEEASIYTENFCKTTGHDHFMRCLILQKTAALVLQTPEAKPEDYLQVLHDLGEAYTGLELMLGKDPVHIFSAEILHLYGIAFNKLGQPENALKKFELALQTMKALSPQNIIKMEQTKHEIALLKNEEKLTLAVQDTSTKTHEEVNQQLEHKAEPSKKGRKFTLTINTAAERRASPSPGPSRKCSTGRPVSPRVLTPRASPR